MRAEHKLKRPPKQSTAASFHGAPASSIAYYDTLTVEHPELDSPLEFCTHDPSHCALVLLFSHLSNMRNCGDSCCSITSLARACASTMVSRSKDCVYCLLVLEPQKYSSKAPYTHAIFLCPVGRSSQDSHATTTCLSADSVMTGSL